MIDHRLCGDERVKQECRDKLRECARIGLAKAHAAGNHNVQRVIEIAIAALEYGDAYHTGDANCLAGDHDDCSAREALEKLEALVGSPWRKL